MYVHNTGCVQAVYIGVSNPVSAEPNALSRRLHDMETGRLMAQQSLSQVCCNVLYDSSGLSRHDVTNDMWKYI